MVRQLTYLSIASILLTTWVSCQVSGPSYGQWEKKGGLEAYRIHTSKLRGAFVAGDQTQAVKGSGHGLKGLVFLPTGKDLHPEEGTLGQVSRSVGIFNLYRVYSRTAPYGALRQDAARVRQLVDGAELTWPASEERPVEVQVVWRVTGPAQVDLRLVAVADEPLQNFEIILANYVAFDMTKGVYVAGQEGPQLFRIRRSVGHGNEENYSFFPLGAEARRAQQQSGRILSSWKWRSHVCAEDAALPIAFADDGKTQIVLMGEPESTSAICVTPTPSNPPPEGWSGVALHTALYFSLFCRDVDAGERLTARARLVVLEQPKDSRERHGELYEEFLSGRS